jgi:hypothetical protein
METLNLNIPTPPICRMIATEKSGALWVADVSGMFSIRPENFNPRAMIIGESIRAEKMDFILASRNGGVWRLMDGRVQKWKSGELEKDFGTYPWGNSAVKAACRRPGRQPDCRHAGRGRFLVCGGRKYRRISKEQGLSSAFVLSCAWIGREIFGWEPTAAVWIGSKEKFSTPRTEHHSWVVQSISGDASGGLWTAFNAHGVSYWFTNSVQDFGVGRGSNAWTVLVDRRNNASGWALATKGFSSFKPIIFNPRPARKFSDRKFCLV